MMKSGLKPTRFDRRDRDFHKSFGSIAPIVFPDSYNADLGKWCPSQNEPEPIFNNPALPMGCTDYTTADISADESGFLRNPMDVENITHANALGGLDIRVALDATRPATLLKPNRLGWATAYFNIQPTGGLTMFDSIRLAMLYTRQEMRTVSVGTPWYPEWVQPVVGSGGNLVHVGSDGILPMPISPISQATWHNWKIAGWKTINGQPYLICKPWLGVNYADKGFCYMSREVCNYIFSIRYTAAYTLSKRTANANIPVSFDIIGWILSMIHWLIPNK